MGFERQSSVRENPAFRFAGKIFGFDAEIKTDNSSRPMSFETICSDKKIGLDVNKKFASLIVGEFLGSLGAVLMERHEKPEMASRIREKMKERRSNHEFGETLDRIEEALEPLTECLRERLGAEKIKKAE